MKLEITKRGSKEFYDEVLYVISKYKTIINNSNTKIHGLRKDAILLGLISLIFSIINLLIYYRDKAEKFFLYISYFFIFLIILSIIYYIIINNRINKLREPDDKITITFDNKRIAYKRTNTKYDIKWEDIKYILINKYSINFIPKDKNNILLSISTEYQDKVLEAIKKYKYEELIIKKV